MEWYKSSYSSDVGNCVEIAQLPGGPVVRDSKNPDDAMLTFSHAEWAAFVAGIRGGQFD
jgi:Domain of unknown function (DUF397)